MSSSTQNECVPLYSTLGADPDFGELVGMFVDEMPSRVAVLEESFRDGNHDALARAAHQLKGAAGSYGFQSLTDYAGRLERMVRHTQGEAEILIALNDLLALCQRVRAGGPESA